ncbi:hypothetical protein QA601_10230 [Chitinispirillales bacterium ANBcel5]|uniref:RNA recognition motif domain-containing protein n=1 Tax=Cellulosispirillum alkaliphilum TaxID=3039283 RepID=UPI002A535620|nr:hypothetical protein [Chitinispirillales bacterium ANBcel5]
MSQKLYIGNLPYRTTENDVRQLFNKYEPIHSVVLISDRETGRSRGFGFIELDEDCADAAISELGDTIFGGRNLRISKARDRDEGMRAGATRMQAYNRS